MGGLNGSNASDPDALGTVSDRCADTSLTITDFGQLSTVAGYLRNQTSVNRVIEKYLPGWEIVYQQEYNIENGSRSTFLHLARGKTSVIAVRGTSSAVEVLQDLNFWMPVGFMQIARKLGPSLFSTRGIILMTTVNRDLKRTRALSDLVAYIAFATGPFSDRADDTWYFTGHSLGGGLATALGSIFNKSAITFSAPGLKATAALLRPEPDQGSLVHLSVNVVPDHDLVPAVDEQTGTVLRIQCPSKVPWTCHRLAGTMCELLATCGDGGGSGIPRGYNRTCRGCGKFSREQTAQTPDSCPAEAGGSDPPDPGDDPFDSGGSPLLFR